LDNKVFFDRLSKIPQAPNLTQISQVTAEMVHADGRTDRPKGMTKLIAAFRNFTNVPRSSWVETRHTM